MRVSDLERTDDLKVLATAGLILTDTLIFHEVIARFNPQTKTLAQIKLAGNIKKALEDEWLKVLEINYAPVFELSLNILKNLPASPALNRQLHSLIEMAYDIAASHVLLRHDLMGRIYHELLLGKLVKYYATLYTSIPAARLLARLVINLPSEIKCDYVPPKYGEDDLRVVDFACGSGTLLSAIYKEVDARHRVDSKMPDSNAVHRFLIENGLWGFDVLLHAVHLSALTLFLHNPSSPVTLSNVYVLPLGIKGKPGVAHFGSLDFLQSSKISSMGRLIGGFIGAQKVSISKRSVEAKKIPNFHICIMNPPFTRSVGGNLLFGSLPKEERKKLQKELKKLLQNKKLTGIGQAGLGAIFVFLADVYLKKYGRLAFVLPKAVLAGISWQKIRKLLLTKYHLEYVISSFEGPNNWNFSENTSLSEVLLVARKLKETEKRGYTIFVNMWSKPRNEVESIFIGSLLLDLYNGAKLHDICNANASSYHLRLHGKKIGEAYSARLDEVDLGFYQLFAQAELNRTMILLRQGTIYLPTKGIVGRVPLVPLTNFVDRIGPDRRQVHNVFKKGNRYRPGCSYYSLWGHDSDKITTIEQEPNICLDPLDEGLARRLWQRRGSLLVVERARLSTYRVLTAITTQEVLSNVWWPTKTNDVHVKNVTLSSEDISKLLALWFNSTYGIMLLLSAAEVTEGAWVGFKKASLSEIPVLDFSKLSARQAKDLLDVYNDIRHQELKPLPNEFAKPNVRRKIDDAFGKVLKIDQKLDDLYRLLARDPTITAESLK